jgi:WD40 repeat protein
VVAKVSAPVIAIATGGRSVAWAGDRVLYVKSGRARARVLHKFSSQINALAFARTGDTLAAGTALGDVYVWRLDGGTAPASAFVRCERVESVALTADGAYVAAVGGPQQGDIWSTTGDAHHYTIPGDAATTVAFDPSGASLATGISNGFVHVWNDWRARPTEVARFYDSWAVTAMQFTEDGRFLVSLPNNGIGHKRPWSNDVLLDDACRRLGRFDTSGELAAYGVICGQVAGARDPARMAVTP